MNARFPFRHPGLVPGSNVPRKNRLMRVRNLGPRDKPGVTGVEAAQSRAFRSGTGEARA